MLHSIIYIKREILSLGSGRTSYFTSTILCRWCSVSSVKFLHRIATVHRGALPYYLVKSLKNVWSTIVTPASGTVTNYPSSSAMLNKLRIIFSAHLVKLVAWVVSEWSLRPCGRLEILQINWDISQTFLIHILRATWQLHLSGVGLTESY